MIKILKGKWFILGIIFLIIGLFIFSNQSFAQTPTGKIAFVKADNLGNNANIWLVNADGSDAKQITTDNDSESSCWFYDGRLVVVRSHQQHPKYGSRKFPTEIWAMNPDGSQPEKLLSADEGTNFGFLGCSPKELKIAYTLINESGEKSIYVFEIGGKPQKVTSLSRSSSPSFTPDDQRILFSREYQASPADDKHDAIFSIALDGTDEKLVFDDPMSYHTGPVISPDGTRLAFYRLASRNIGIHDSQYVMLANADGSDAKMFRPDFGGANQSYARWDTSWPDFSADGKYLVFGVRANKLEPEATPETSVWEESLWVAPIDGGKAIKIADGGTQPAWQKGEAKAVSTPSTSKTTKQPYRPSTKDMATAAAVGAVLSAASTLIINRTTKISGKPGGSRAAELIKLAVYAIVTFLVAATVSLVVAWRIHSGS